MMSVHNFGTYRGGGGRNSISGGSFCRVVMALVIIILSAKVLSTKDLGRVPQNSTFRADACLKELQEDRFGLKRTTHSSGDDRMTMRWLVGGTPQFKTLVRQLPDGRFACIRLQKSGFNSGEFDRIKRLRVDKQGNCRVPL